MDSSTGAAAARKKTLMGERKGVMLGDLQTIVG